jgi:hypothetical protein
MALKNHRAQDVDLLSEVMDEDFKTKILQIVAKLAKCMIPEADKEFNLALAKDFEKTLTNASSKSLADDEKPKSLKEFINKGIENKPAFSIVETKDYEDANYIYSDLDELASFKPSDDETGPAFNPYDKITDWIVSRGELIVAKRFRRILDLIKFYLTFFSMLLAGRKKR